MNNILDENDLKSLFGTGNPAPVSIIPQTPPPPQPQPSKPEAQPTESIQPKIFTPKAPGKIDILEDAISASKAKAFTKNFLRISWRFFLLFLLLFAISYSLINISAITSKLRYFYNFTLGNKTPSQQAPAPVFDSTSAATLSIPKIGVSAPIQWNVDVNNYQDKLLTGLVHFQGTALPGQNGNIFITGHSSYYSWVSSPYKDIFALLDKLTTGDKIYIQYQNATYIYTVNGSKVVSPDNLEVLGSGFTPTLTLMTCVPIGTNLNRLIITADQTNASVRS